MQRNLNKEQRYCINCGYNGHLVKDCREPVISIGIICIKCKDINLKNELIKKFRGHVNDFSDYINILNMNYLNINSIKNISNIVNNIEFLLIQRKHSIGFIEFVRGRYNPDNYRQIINLFEHMTLSEIRTIDENDFDTIWNTIWSNNVKLPLSSNSDYNKAKEKFNILKNKTDDSFSLKFFTKNILPKWETAEWGFPKGRRMFRESNIKCAIREFNEETGIQYSDYTILNKILPLKEIYKGTNNVTYKLVYFLAILNDNEMELPQITSNEIGNIEWYNYLSFMNVVRDYHLEKKKCLQEVMQFLSSI